MNREEIASAEREINLRRETASKAAVMLESEVFLSAVAKLKEKHRKALRDVTVENVLQLQMAKLRMDLLEDVIGELGLILRAGKSTEFELKDLARKRERLK